MSDRNCTVYGLYALDNPDHVRYVGQTIRLVEQRFKEHLNCAKRLANTYCTKWILKENKKIGVKILKKNAKWNKSEKRIINSLLNKGHKLTNLTTGGDGTLGYSHTVKTKKKLSYLKTGNILSEKTKGKMSAAHEGRVYKLHNEETKKKIRYSLTGKKLSKETKKKMGEAHKGRIYKSHSEETRKKISETKKKMKLTSHRKGKTFSPHSEETKKRMSEAHKNRVREPHSEETKKKIGEKSKGRKHSEETRKKMRKAHERRLKCHH